jgi:hypothetical protein
MEWIESLLKRDDPSQATSNLSHKGNLATGSVLVFREGLDSAFLSRRSNRMKEPSRCRLFKINKSIDVYLRLQVLLELLLIVSCTHNTSDARVIVCLTSID